MVHLGCMKLDVPWNFSCIRIGWHWSCLWGADRALKIFPNYSSVSGWLHCQPEETMMTPSQFWLDCWRVCLNFAMDFADNFVVEDPLTFCYFLEGEFAANIFRFGIHCWLFWFHQVWCAWIFYNQFHRVWCAWIFLESLEPSFLVYWPGSNLPCLLIFFRLGLNLPCLFPFFPLSWILWLFFSCGFRAIFLCYSY